MIPVELVITRYCEDLTWLDGFPSEWPRTIYDKSGGGPRQRVHLPGWSSADGPELAALWPGATPLINVGCESHAHMHHIIERWDSLADVTVFLSGDGPGHIPDLVDSVQFDVQRGEMYVPYGDPYTCDADGAPNAPGLGPELKEAFAIFYPWLPVPKEIHFHGFSMYLAHRFRIEMFPRHWWVRGRDWCTTKRRSLAMERLYDRMFG